MPRRWWQWVILLVLIWDWGRATVPRVLTPDVLLGSFDAFWWAGHCVVSGRDIYSPPPNTTERNVYPPFHALLMVPIAILPKKVAFFLWQVGQLVALAFCFFGGFKKAHQGFAPLEHQRRKNFMQGGDVR